MGKGIARWWLPPAAVLGALAAVCWLPADAADQRRPDKPDQCRTEDAGPQPDDVGNPLGANAACYVCHIPLVKDQLSKVHLKAKVTCTECHGLSAGHANDEDIGATKPDVVYARKQVDAMCRKCHQKHDAPARLVVTRFVNRGLSRPAEVVCTDCHGRHRIEPPEEEKPRIAGRPDSQ